MSVQIDGERQIMDGTIPSSKLADLERIRFDPAYGGPLVYEEGALYWSSDDKTLNIESGLDNVILQIGQEFLIQIKNQTGAQLDNGTVVSYDGTVGASGRIKGKKLLADGSEPSNLLLGIATMDIPNGQDGFVTFMGKVRDVDTDSPGWAEGEILYADPATPGGLTNVEPTAPDHELPLAIVVTVHPVNGVLFVRALPGLHFGQLDDVYADSPSDGDIVTWSVSNDRWEKTSVTDVGASLPVPVYNKTTSDTLTAENQFVTASASIANFTLTLPAAADSTGFLIRVKKKDSTGYRIFIDGNGAETIDGYDKIALDAQNQAYSLMSDGTEWNIV